MIPAESESWMGWSLCDFVVRGADHYFITFTLVAKPNARKAQACLFSISFKVVSQPGASVGNPPAN